MNCQFPIANFQLFGLGCRFARSGENNGQLTRFTLQFCNSTLPYQICVGDHLKPKLNFVRFFFGDADFGNEFRAGPGLARRSIIRRSRCPSAGDLIRQNASFHLSRELLGQGENSKSEFFTAFLQLFGGHTSNRREKRRSWKALIANWKLEIGNEFGGHL